MIDIVERLRAEAIRCGQETGLEPEVFRAWEAADEIKRLRTALSLARNDMRDSINEIDRELSFVSGGQS